MSRDDGEKSSRHALQRRLTAHSVATVHRLPQQQCRVNLILTAAVSQAPAYQDGPSRGFSSSGGYGPSSGGGSYGPERSYSSGGGGFGPGGGYGMGPGSQADPWTEAVNAVSTTVEQNLKVAATYASSLSSWASTLIANLDPAALLFEDDDEYDGPVRCARAWLPSPYMLPGDQRGVTLPMACCKDVLLPLPNYAGTLSSPNHAGTKRRRAVRSACEVQDIDGVCPPGAS